MLDRAQRGRARAVAGSGKDKIAGGIYCPTDETGDSHKFTRALAAKLVARGGAVHTGTTITAIETAGDASRAGAHRRPAFKGDAYVLALGSYSPILARKIGIVCRSIRSRAIR